MFHDISIMSRYMRAIRQSTAVHTYIHAYKYNSICVNDDLWFMIYDYEYEIRQKDIEMVFCDVLCFRRLGWSNVYDIGNFDE